MNGQTCLREGMKLVYLACPPFKIENSIKSNPFQTTLEATTIRKASFQIVLLGGYTLFFVKT